jgi:phosphopantothenoylcysteine decarboxylase/phosphopantothenate--cysteine ligase
MRQAVLANLKKSSVLIMASAVSDYRPKETSAQKIKKSSGDLKLPLELNPDILAEAGKRKGKRFHVGFAAETENLLQNAQRKLAEKKLDLIVANDVSLPGAGFQVGTNIVKLIFPAGRIEELPLMSKEELADRLLDRIIQQRKS